MPTQLVTYDGSRNALRRDERLARRANHPYEGQQTGAAAERDRCEPRRMQAELWNRGERAEQQQRGEGERDRTAPLQRHPARFIARQVAPRADACEDRDERGRQKDRAPAEEAREDAAQRRPERLSRAVRHRPRAERERAVTGIVEFGQQRQDKRHDAGGRRALHDAHGDEHGEVRRERAGDAADSVDGDDDAIHLTPAETVADPIAQRQQRRERDRLRGDEQ